MESSRNFRPEKLRISASVIVLIAVTLILGCLVGFNHERLRLTEIHIASDIGKTAGVHSFELRDLPARTTYSESVYAWIAKYRNPITAEGQRWRVDPIAIAGVVAYEAIENPIPPQLQGWVRFSGPGKVHYKEFHTAEGDPVARQVETRGYLPRRTAVQRERFLRTPEGAFIYIAAIMNAFAVIASSHHHAIRCRPALLATFFNAWDLPGAEQFLASHQQRPLRASVVGIWITRNRTALSHALQPSPVCNFKG
jgi:hypothetical protein